VPRIVGAIGVLEISAGGPFGDIAVHVVKAPGIRTVRSRCGGNHALVVYGLHREERAHLLHAGVMAQVEERGVRYVREGGGVREWGTRSSRPRSVPARQAHSHFASSGSLNSRPVFRESQLQKALASSQDTRQTGCRGWLRGGRWPGCHLSHSIGSTPLSCAGSKLRYSSLVTSVLPIQKGRSIRTVIAGLSSGTPPARP